MPNDTVVDVTALLAEARDDVQHADQKASLLLAALGIGFGAVIGGQLSSSWDSSSLSTLGQFAFWVGVAAAVGSVAACAWAIWPRYVLTDEAEFGVTYWGHVAAYDNLDHLHEALAVTFSPQRRTEHQLWRISRLVLAKYRCVRVALIAAAFAGVILFFALVVLG